MAGDGRAESGGPLVIPSRIWRDIVSHLSACLPNEGVGLLGVSRGPGVTQVTEFFPGRNLNESPSRFTMDPADVLAALQAMDRAGSQLGGIVHSHPRTAPAPSATDLRELALPGVINLIVQMRPHVEARAWIISAAGESGAQEVTFQIR
ncbi:MAG: M67 family metallopeptidase [Thermomicrobiales bacterium]